MRKAGSLATVFGRLSRQVGSSASQTNRPALPVTKIAILFTLQDNTECDICIWRL
jgi:hypothetical protein